jgi:hypothetical protein
MTEPSALGTPDAPAGPPSRPRLSRLAVASLVAGLLTVCPWVVMLTGLPAPLAGLARAVPLLLLAGPPALVLGLAAVRRINGSDGRVAGRVPAVAGMVLGGVGLVLLPAFGLLAGVMLGLREQAAEAECQNNLRLIGMAVNGYQNAEGRYPQALVPNPTLPADEPDRHLSWLVAILPHLDAAMRPPAGPGAPTPRPSTVQATYERFDLGKAWDAPENRAAAATPLRWFRCPSAPGRAAPGAPALTNYVGITGLGPDSAALPADDPRAGFFGYERRLTRDQLHAARGDSRTLMAAETTWENGPWAQGGPATVRPVDPAQRPYAGPGRPFGGSHPHTFNAVFADGAVVPSRDGINPAVLEALVPITAEKEGQ